MESAGRSPHKPRSLLTICVTKRSEAEEWWCVTWKKQFEKIREAQTVHLLLKLSTISRALVPLPIPSPWPLQKWGSEYSTWFQTQSGSLLILSWALTSDPGDSKTDSSMTLLPYDLDHQNSLCFSFLISKMTQCYLPRQLGRLIK